MSLLAVTSQALSGLNATPFTASVWSTVSSRLPEAALGSPILHDADVTPAASAAADAGISLA